MHIEMWPIGRVVPYEKNPRVNAGAVDAVATSLREAGVENMTYWEHLTRDHGFDPVKIEGLNEEEQAKLHAAAHDGY